MSFEQELLRQVQNSEAAKEAYRNAEAQRKAIAETAKTVKQIEDLVETSRKEQNTQIEDLRQEQKKQARSNTAVAIVTIVIGGLTLLSTILFGILGLIRSV